MHWTNNGGFVEDGSGNPVCTNQVDQPPSGEQRIIQLHSDRLIVQPASSVGITPHATVLQD